MTVNYDYKKMANSAKAFVSHLNNMGIDAKLRTPRYVTEIKSVQIKYAEVYESGGLSDFFNKLNISCLLTPLSQAQEKTISGKYKAKLVTLASDVGKYISKNDNFFIVNIHTENSTLNNKETAPEKLGIIKTYHTLPTFDNDVMEGIKKLNIDSTVKLAMQGLYDTVKDNKKYVNKIDYTENTKNLMKSIRQGDKAMLGKDFGEVLSLRWFLTQRETLDWKEFNFATSSNSRLIDYTVYKNENSNKIPINVSAKYDKGAAPSIKALVDLIPVVYRFPNPNEKAALEVIKILASEDKFLITSARILKVMEILKHPCIAELQKILNKSTFTIKDIHDHIANIGMSHNNKEKRLQHFNKQFKKVYEKIGKVASIDSQNVVFGSKTFNKYYSLVISPMGYALVDILNKDSVYQDILNNLSRKLEITQIHTVFEVDNIKFEYKYYHNQKFKFTYGANAKNSDNTGIKFIIY